MINTESNKAHLTLKFAKLTSRKYYGINRSIILTYITGIDNGNSYGIGNSQGSAGIRNGNDNSGDANGNFNGVNNTASLAGNDNGNINSGSNNGVENGHINK